MILKHRFITLMLALGLVSGAHAYAADSWIGTWDTSEQIVEQRNLPPEPGLGDTTLRQTVHVTIGGSRIRVHLSNVFGAAPLDIEAAHVALPSGPGQIDTSTDHALTFAKAASVTIPTGAEVASDPIDFKIAPGSDLDITIYVKDPTTIVTGHPGSRMTSYLLSGNSVTAASLNGAATTAHWYYISEVDVPAKGNAAVVTLGDSITDGRGSTTDGSDRWPDAFASLLRADPKTANVAVLNAGIGGNKVIPPGGLGPTALDRLNRDVLTQPGVKWVILFEGINDIGGGGDPAIGDKLITAFKSIVTQCHAHNIKVYGATITPCGGSFYDSANSQAAIAQVNNWIKTPGNCDGVIDFNTAVADPANPTHMLAAYDSGDHLHLNPTGYKTMAAAIDLKLFEGK